MCPSCRRKRRGISIQARRSIIQMRDRLHRRGSMCLMLRQFDMAHNLSLSCRPSTHRFVIWPRGGGRGASIGEELYRTTYCLIALWRQRRSSMKNIIIGMERCESAEIGEHIETAHPFLRPRHVTGELRLSPQLGYLHERIQTPLFALNFYWLISGIWEDQRHTDPSAGQK